MTKALFSNYNYQPDWIKDYYDDYLIYDRSDNKDYLKDFPQDKVKYVENIGTDIADKFLWIIENYDNLPDVVLLSKSNLFKYCPKSEFDLLKDRKEFTPLLSQRHKTYMPVCYYKNGIYWEINNFWYLTAHPPKNEQAVEELSDLLGLRGLSYVPFAPGSNYILPKENILKHPKEFYEKLRSYLMWSRYCGEAQIIERGLYNMWK